MRFAKALEHAALSDEYFIKRKLFPNVDFYSGITLTALGAQSPPPPMLFRQRSVPLFFSFFLFFC